MARDYAKKTKPKAKSKAKAKPRKTSHVNKTQSVSWQGFVGGFVLGGLLVGIIVYALALNSPDMPVYSEQTQNETYLSEAAQLELAQQLVTLDDNEAPITPQFDFYRLLPEMAIEIPENSAETAIPEVVASALVPTVEAPTENQTEPVQNEATTQAPNLTPPTSPETAIDLHYELQLAAFRSAGDADAYKARLALLGYVVNVQDVTTDEGETWHRIRVGPFTAREQAEQTQAQLQTQQINSLLLQVSG